MNVGGPGQGLGKGDPAHTPGHTGHPRGLTHISGQSPGQSPEQSLVLVGEIIKPHGLKGEFSVKIHVESPDFFSQVSRLYLRRAAGERARRVGVTSQRNHNGRVLLCLEQIQGRDQVERMRGAELLVRPEDLPRVSAEDVFLHDLIGMLVALPSEESLGKISAVSINAGQEVWTIRTAAEQEILFPAHPDFILALDMDTRTVCIDPPPGLLELYLGEDSERERQKGAQGE